MSLRVNGVMDRTKRRNRFVRHNDPDILSSFLYPVNVAVYKIKRLPEIRILAVLSAFSSSVITGKKHKTQKIVNCKIESYDLRNRKNEIYFEHSKFSTELDNRCASVNMYAHFRWTELLKHKISYFAKTCFVYKTVGKKPNV